MISRVCQSALTQLLASFPAVALLGPRQVGKTTLALEQIENNSNATYLDLENPADKLKVVSDPIDYFARHPGFRTFSKLFEIRKRNAKNLKHH